MLQPPLPLQSFFPAHEFDSGTAQPPLPLQSFFPMQQSLSPGALTTAGAPGDTSLGALFESHPKDASPTQTSRPQNGRTNLDDSDTRPECTHLASRVE
jgi:hypothetical protein